MKLVPIRLDSGTMYMRIVGWLMYWGRDGYFRCSASLRALVSTALATVILITDRTHAIHTLFLVPRSVVHEEDGLSTC